MSKIPIIARQEFKMTAANKAFVIITLLGPFLILAVTVLPTLLAQNDDSIAENTTIGILGGDQAIVMQLNTALNPSNLIFNAYGNRAQMETLVKEGDLQGILILPEDFLHAEEFTYLSRTGTDIIISETIKQVLGQMVVTARMNEAGLDPRQVQTLSQYPSMNARKLVVSDAVSEEPQQGQDFLSILLTALSFVMLIYMTVLLYGQMIGRSVVKEKTSKTVEIMLSSSKPSEIMFGKILGIGFAGLVQYIFWIAMALLLINVVGPVFDLEIPAALTVTNLLFLVAFFICAYFLYSSIYAALGAAAEDEQHMGQLAWPILIFLIIPMVMISSIVMNPSSVLIQVMSYFPLTSPLIMLVRVLVDMPQIWELAACFAVLIGSIFIVVLAGARIFRIGILLTGKRVSFGEIFKWIREA